MKRLFNSALLLAPCLLLTGCFEVKNTDGLRAAYEKIELAYPLAAEIKRKTGIEDEKRQAVIDSYNEAKAAVNSFLEDVKTKSVKTVDISRDTFEKDKANTAIDKFIRDAKIARGRSPASTGTGLLIAGAVIDKIWELHQKDENEAYNRFIKIIDDNKMVEYSKVPGN